MLRILLPATLLLLTPACVLDLDLGESDTDTADTTDGGDVGDDAGSGTDGDGADGGQVDETGGDGEPWPDAELPEPVGDVLPMSCEWLQSDNCWKQMIAQAQTCSPVELGTSVDSGSACEHPDGPRTEYSSQIDPPEPESSTIYVRDFRILDEDGAPCLSAAIEGWGLTSVTVDDATATFRNDTLLAYTLTCPDGTQYSNGVEGTCETFGLEWLAQEAPGMVLIGRGEDGIVQVEVNGVEEAPQVLSACQL